MAHASFWVGWLGPEGLVDHLEPAGAGLDQGNLGAHAMLLGVGDVRLAIDAAEVLPERLAGADLDLDQPSALSGLVGHQVAGPGNVPTRADAPALVLKRLADLDVAVIAAAGVVGQKPSSQ